MSHFDKFVTLTILLLCSPFVIADQTCYWPNGAVAQGYVPCNPGQTNSMCCAGQGESACLSNGLCLWLADFSIDRGGCTDSSWASGACVQTCRNNPNDGHADVTQCLNTTSLEYCCGFNNDCCNGVGGVLAVGVAAPTGGSFFAVSMPGRSSTSTAFPTGSATTSTTSNSLPTTSSYALSTRAAPSATTCPTPSNSSQCHEVAIGAGVGVPLGLAFIIAFGLFLLEHWRRKRDNIAAGALNTGTSQQINYKYDNTLEHQQMRPVELS
ncbi:hypothetical protein K432DRAFT_386335 [Lepidopterella palustris CBS 459.81]|uniref:Mid2 domain-containing protein n=1 Tax=Lepidopterella palustris CBS 459.81 TaxID=1314670 RepID=A0A8E2JAW0_9PEZI|nr:hypothetical protein K432DRAFT_386335 [Lepidopterella palustris CBS 459.81]